MKVIKIKHVNNHKITEFSQFWKSNLIKTDRSEKIPQIKKDEIIFLQPNQ